MITTEYSVAGPAQITIAIVADLHEFEPKPVLSRLSEIRPDVIAVPGDLFENHEFGENLDKEDDSLISRMLCRIIHIVIRNLTVSASKEGVVLFPPPIDILGKTNIF